MIRTTIPKRAAGQRDVLGLAVAPIPVVRVGFVGLGKRGLVGLERWLHLPDVQVSALCDLSADNIKAATKVLQKAAEHNIGGVGDRTSTPSCRTYTGADGYKQLCRQPDLDLVYVCTDWLHHTDIAVEAMNQGKHVALEVPAAHTLNELWRIVDTAERTRRHCMMLENSVYDFFELSVLNMAKHGVFGQIVHAEGGYLHNLEEKWEPWRMAFNAGHRGDVYPSHGFGPACQLLDIHRKDSLDYLVSVDTASFSGAFRYEQLFGQQPNTFLNGDLTTTVVKTQQGKTILLQHNVMTPQPYSRFYQVTGTEGWAIKYPVPQICLSEKKLTELGFLVPKGEDCGRQPLSKEIQDELLDRFEPDYAKRLKTLGSRLDHYGGMAYFMDYRLCEALHQGRALDMDVYDLAEWSAVAPLSALSLEHGAEPVAFPDFTRNQCP